MDDSVRGRPQRALVRYPAGLAAGPAYFGPLAVCGMAGRAGSPSRLAAEVVLLALIVAVVGFEAAAPAGLVAVGSSVLSLNGFAEHDFGELGWKPGPDFTVALVLSCVWGIAWAAREGVSVHGRSQHHISSTLEISDSEEGDL